MNRKLLTQLLLCIAALLILSQIFSSTVFSIPPVTQNTLIVDINGNGDYVSIKDAINGAKSTDIIKIKDGVYQENDLEINKKLTIIGDSPSSTIIDFGGEKGFILYSTHIDISDLKLTNAGEYAVYVPPENNGCTITNCIIDKYGAGIGVSIEASSVVISNCNISGYNSTAIGIRVSRQFNNIIKGCTIQGFDVGVLIQLNTHDNKILNCNLINNQAGIDIRINSHDNIVSECNVYSNTNGVYIWQNSNSNILYRNNFWKNDVSAADECNNSWDNGDQGNYWDDYQGQDENHDGIGDTPYMISGENKDKHPIMNMIVPDVITLPTNIKQVTSMSDDKPSFSWTSSVYSKKIKGYYVKIDKNTEKFIGDTNSWTTPISVSNGIHIFYIRAETIDNTSSRYATVAFYVDTSANASLIDSDSDEYSDAMELSYGTNLLDPNSHPIDTDHDGIPDNDSPDGKYQGDLDDDNDGVTDVEEIKLGSNTKNKLDVSKIYLGGKPYYLVDVNQDGTFDVLYNQATETTTAIEKKGDKYLIDRNGDTTWDYIYDTTGGSISTYGEELPILSILIILVLVIIAIISSIAWYYIKNRLKYRKYEEHQKPEKKPVEKLPTIRKPVSTVPRISTTDRRYTIAMMNETRVLLQKIEQGFAEYAEKLREMDEEIEETYPDIEKEEIYQEIKKNEIKQEDIESQVDRLLSDLSKNKKSGE